MGTTPDYPLIGPPRISTLGFSAVLSSNRSPAAPEALYAYRAALDQGVDPAVLLAVFRKESTFGRFGKAARNRSWGNIRDPQTGAFRAYSSWTDGARDAARLLAVYGRNQIRPGRDTSTVQTMPYVWAPAADGNGPDRYGDQLARWISEWQRKYPASGSGAGLPPPTGVLASTTTEPTVTPGPPWIDDDSRVLSEADLRVLKTWILANNPDEAKTLEFYLERLFFPNPLSQGFGKGYVGRTLGELRRDAPALFTATVDFGGDFFGGIADAVGGIPEALGGVISQIVVNGALLAVVVGLGWSGLRDLLGGSSE